MNIGYHSFDKGGVPPIEYHPGKEGEKFVVGELLTLTADGLTKCAATAVPTHLGVGPMQSDGTVPATRVHPDIEYSGPLNADGAALKVGDRVTISEEATEFTATTGGAAEIVRMEGTEPGDQIHVRFRATTVSASGGGNSGGSTTNQ